jgi:hypothetical protein
MLVVRALRPALVVRALVVPALIGPALIGPALIAPPLVASALLAATLMVPSSAVAQINLEISANIAPPELPVYEQPPIPAEGYLWTPGYWAWGDDIQDYYWVPGTWVQAPQPNYLWTPGYWGMDGAVFLFHPGYWGPHVGFYGGVNYGYGYGGAGYEGGYWQGGHLYYNRSVNNISNVNVTNVYNKTVVNNITVNRVSYNGGNGVHAAPTAADLAASREPHVAATPAQLQHVQMARSQPALRASENHGRPAIAATPQPAAFHGPGVVGARPSGAVSVVHQNPPPHDNLSQRSMEQRTLAAPRAEAPRVQPEAPRAEAPRVQPEAPRAPPERRPEVVQPRPQAAPAPAARPAEAPHANAPEPHAAPPRPGEREPPRRE